jgi:hypothetical protein
MEHKAKFKFVETIRVTRTIVLQKYSGHYFEAAVVETSLVEKPNVFTVAICTPVKQTRVYH